MTATIGAAWAIAGLATAGAALLVLFGLMPVGEAGMAAAKGTDVYLFWAA